MTENSLRQNRRLNGPRPSLGPNSRRIGGLISRRNLEQNQRPNQQRPNSMRAERPILRRILEQTRRQALAERRQPRTHDNPGPESLTARRAACSDNVYIQT